LEARRLSEQALLNVIQEAYLQGVSTRKVETLVQRLGLEKMDKSKVSRITQGLQAEVDGFRSRPLPEKCIYLFLDAVYPKVRLNHRVVNVALVIAIGILENGRRVILGFEVGAAETEAFWSEFLRSLMARGLNGVQLVISDAHEGLRQALAKVLHGATWQRCRVHFMRNLLAHVPQKDKAQVAAWVRTIFAQPNLEAAQAQLSKVKDEFKEQWPQAAALLEKAAEDVLAFMNFPEEHRKRLASNNLLERLNREIRRRTDVVQVFPNEDSLIRLVGALLIEVDTEWAVGRRYFSVNSMQKALEKG
jgi:transposase-like protein